MLDHLGSAPVGPSPTALHPGGSVHGRRGLRCPQLPHRPRCDPLRPGIPRSRRGRHCRAILPASTWAATLRAEGVLFCDVTDRLPWWGRDRLPAWRCSRARDSARPPGQPGWGARIPTARAGAGAWAMLSASARLRRHLLGLRLPRLPPGPPAELVRRRRIDPLDTGNGPGTSVDGPQGIERQDVRDVPRVVGCRSAVDDPPRLATVGAGGLRSGHGPTIRRGCNTADPWGTAASPGMGTAVHPYTWASIVSTP